MNIETKEYLKSRAGIKKSKVKTEPDHNGAHNALLLDAPGAAGLLGFTRQYFYQLQSSGRLGPEPFYFGKRTRWSRFELESWVRAGCPNREKWLELMKTEKITA